ncbi:hypothetical protein A3A41_03585 [Candidatus Kaiserbacteria bacterium RIFCSPLOWO2_01_FULL_54_22]|nr:MAG: hypothetical protein A3A41_03585 [Candidatus Kaiserbacteria bacterium RIFCSPLOWO2_01_FULL_54_22]
MIAISQLRRNAMRHIYHDGLGWMSNIGIEDSNARHWSHVVVGEEMPIPKEEFIKLAKKFYLEAEKHFVFPWHLKKIMIDGAEHYLGWIRYDGKNKHHPSWGLVAYPCADIDIES